MAGFQFLLSQLVQNVDELMSRVILSISENYSSDNWLCGRAILAPTNNIVTDINQQILKLILGNDEIYYSLAMRFNAEEATLYPTEFLNSLELS